MTIIDPLPTPFFRFPTAECDDEGTFASPKVSVTLGPTTSTFTKSLSSPQSVPTASLSSFARAIERCFYVDLSDENDVLGFDVDGASIEVELVTDSADVPLGIEVRIASPASTVLYTLGEAWSIAAMIRKAGHGTAYVPPSA